MRKLVVFLALSAAPLAFGQAFEGAISGGVSNLTNKDIIDFGASNGKYTLADGFRLAFRMTVNPYRIFGFELGYAYNRSHLHFVQGGVDQDAGGMAIHQGFGDALLYATKEGSRIRPFGAVGLNFSNFVPPGASAQYGQGQNKFGFNYGVGVKVKVTGMWQIRFDVRQFNTGKPDFGTGAGIGGRLLQNEISAGVGVAL